MGLQDYARDELNRAGMFDADSDYGGALGNAVMSLVNALAEVGPSGASASLIIWMFTKVAKFQPLTPLTGADDEWIELSDDKPLWQSKRCPSVFKGNAGAYDNNGKIFREPSGACFTNKDSRVPVTFPYTPTSEFVDVN